MSSNNLANIFNFNNWKAFLVNAVVKTFEIMGQIVDSIPAQVKWAIIVIFMVFVISVIFLAVKNKDEWQHVYSS